MGLIEWQYTTEGYIESLGNGGDDFTPLSRDEFDALEEAYNNGDQC